MLQHQDFFPLNLVKDGLAKAFAIEAPRWDGYDAIYLVGRVWSALFATGTVLVVFLTGRLLYDRRVGLLAMLLMSTAVLDIQLAHYFTVDSFLTFFAALTIYYCVRIAKLGRWGDFALAGVAYGFATACKLSGVFLGPIIALAVVCRLWSPTIAFLARRRPVTQALSEPAEETEEPGEPHRTDLARSSRRSDFLLADTRSLHRLPSGRALRLHGPQRVERGDRRQLRQGHARAHRPPVGAATSPSTGNGWAEQPYLFPLQNMVLWGMGLPLGIAAWAGFLWAAWRLVTAARGDEPSPAGLDNLLLPLLGTPVQPHDALLPAHLPSAGAAGGQPPQ